MKKTNLFKVFKAVGIAMAAMIVMSGCGETDHTEVQHVAVAISNTKNEPYFDVSSLLSNISDITMASGSTLSYFNVDGDPEYIDTLTIPEYKRGISAMKKKQIAARYAEQIVTALTGLVPDDEELDIYKAIVLEARQLQEYEGTRTLYVVSSGLSSKGLVDFTDLYLQVDHSVELIEGLKDELPNLKGIKVVWYGLGETCGEQTDLYESNRTILRNTWKNIFVASGVNEEDITFSTALAVNADNKSQELPYVSVVPISQPLSVVAEEDFEFESESGGNISSINNGTILNLSDKVNFKPDSTELLTDSDEVADSLKKIIDYLKEDSSRQILIVGTTSSWGDETSLREFSLKRCETIKNVLLGRGILEEQIQCIGAGYENNLTVDDRDDGGDLVEELAVKNRAVYMYTNAQSTPAQKILEQFAGQH